MNARLISGRSEAHAVIDRWLSATALLDEQGTILFVNQAWRRFMGENGGDENSCGPGVNYLKVCSSASGEEQALATEVASGIQDVLTGRKPWFETYYPCHSPNEARWFRMRVEPFFDEAGARVVVLHSPVMTGVPERESNARRSRGLEELLDTLPLGAAILDRETSDILYANPRFARLLNISDPVGLTGARWADFAADPSVVRTVLREGVARQEELDELHPRAGAPVRVVRTCQPVQFHSRPAALVCFLAIP